MSKDNKISIRVDDATKIAIDMLMKKLGCKKTEVITIAINMLISDTINKREGIMFSAMHLVYNMMLESDDEQAIRIAKQHIHKNKDYSDYQLYEESEETLHFVNGQVLLCMKNIVAIESIIVDDMDVEIYSELIVGLNDFLDFIGEAIEDNY